MEEKSSDILKKKAEETFSLKDHIDEDNFSKVDDVRVEKIVDEEGKEVLVFQDPLFSREKRSVVNYTVFRGRWEFENLDDIDENEGECAVRFRPTKDGSSFTIAFKSLKDRVEFMDSIYSDNEMKQKGTGMNLEKLANSNVLKTTGGIIGAGILGYSLYKMMNKKGAEEKIEPN